MNNCRLCVRKKCFLMHLTRPYGAESSFLRSLVIWVEWMRFKWTTESAECGSKSVELQRRQRKKKHISISFRIDFIGFTRIFVWLRSNQFDYQLTGFRLHWHLSILAFNFGEEKKKCTTRARISNANRKETGKLIASTERSRDVTAWLFSFILAISLTRDRSFTSPINSIGWTLFQEIASLFPLHLFQQTAHNCIWPRIIGLNRQLWWLIAEIRPHIYTHAHQSVCVCVWSTDFKCNQQKKTN